MKIAIVGSAPSSAGLAPYDDPEWTIWVCSPGAIPFAKRFDAWFELHRWGQDWLTKDFRAHLAALTCPVYMIEPVEDVPTSVEYPKDKMLKAFGRAFFTSTPAWMLALAISMKPKEIGIWGIDMASDDEYIAQKPGCHYFIGKAKDRGIRVTVPPQSDLMRTPPLYGFDEANPKLIKMQARHDELKERVARCSATIEAQTREQLYLQGALENMQYVINTWVD